MDREEAIRTVRLCCPKISNSECDFETAMRVLIPELRESEDERMCTRCIDLLRKVSAYSGEEYLGVEIADCIIWLQALIKKLKESLHITEICKEDADSFTDEDERIRKDLIAYLKSVQGETLDLTLNVPKWIAYLEKHKYDRMQPIYDSIDSFESALDKAWKAYNDSGARTVDGCEDDYVECAHAKGFREGYLFGLEKQKENPKSADSIPSDCVSDAKCEDRSPKHTDSFDTDIRDTPAYWKGWDDAMKQKEQKHPNGCFTCDEYKKGYETGRLNGFTAGYNKAMKEVDQKGQKPEERFKEAREKYQVEWSEEDEAAYDAFMCEVVNEKMNPTIEQIKWFRAIRDRLKSLRPSWKPSEEQMEALEECGECKRCIKELYEQLKKLI